MKFTFTMTPGYACPEPGDILEPVPPRRAWYRVLANRKINSRTHPNKWMLDVERADQGAAEPTPDAGGIVHLYS